MPLTDSLKEKTQVFDILWAELKVAVGVVFGQKGSNVSHLNPYE